MSQLEETRPSLEPFKTKLKFVAINLGVSTKACHEDHLEFARKICQDIFDVDLNTFTKQTPCKDPTCHENADNTPYIQTVAEVGVIRLIELMENHKSFNCGIGSNLNMDGQVECDASLMRNKDNAFSSIGAASGCKNPIKLVESLLLHRTIKRPLGLMQPNVLVGSSGCRKWMRTHCPDLLIPDSNLVSATALDRYQTQKSMYDRSVRAGPSSKAKSEESLIKHDSFDTVGAIAIDYDGNYACATSSGGIALKHKGRLGQAAIPGAGCWAQNNSAITTTGVGEFITMSMLARNLCDNLNSSVNKETYSADTLENLVKSHFTDIVNNPTASHLEQDQKLAGFLMVNSAESDESYLLFGCNATSMGVAYRLDGWEESKSEDLSGPLDSPLSTNSLKLKTLRLIS